MLTDAKVRKLKPLDKKARYSDEKGMYLEVTPSGGMYWRLKFRLNGKENIFSIGTYPEVSLAQARRCRDEARLKIKDGINPNELKKAKKLQVDESMLFKVLAMEWMEDRKAVIKDATYLRDLSVFEKDLFPYIGKMPIDQIRGKDIFACAKRIEERGAQEMARRSIPLAGRVFRFAIRKGLIENDPTPHLQEALKPRKVKHMARLDISEFPAFLARMDRYHGNIVIKTALQLMTLTFVRTAELRLMEWDEIDFESKLWRIPADKMKMALPHIVPLSRQAIALLEVLRPITGMKQYVFYNYSTAKPISSNALLCAIRTMGYNGKMTGHGFRGLASTTLHEQGYMHDAIEVQLAHRVGNAVSQAYNHAQYLDYRIKMMQEWSDFIDSLRNNVIPFPKSRFA
ncbi:integrase arm-type DNA-binding domain-containing protein [Acinetobacter baumannii]|uniref:tyrosine-type recombinase/integrase n=1 Tax=Acinetobacter baumannii TaxID=470 RepID=UPI00061722B5|nr:integrase arm-type DNA-binding domain-containing protein [Acinetobacter baumannii]MBD0442191.1 integrase arm-type DNA-binding domain-containing protein [Acinetobacter baumannii]MCR6567092.1 integrase arm-type DNA-binding domain-containing protein [Acinetobacter baumannii]MCW3181539.1 integrase arm-type DNA-binding domain-containing protein [Acinetobacter baumannii]MDV4323060.1 integrase arm-type DNA-binding domain-containing protein [Acinetobacter baumannii]MDV4335833.1 integrase arm-type D